LVEFYESRSRLVIAEATVHLEVTRSAREVRILSKFDGQCGSGKFQTVDLQSSWVWIGAKGCSVPQSDEVPAMPHGFFTVEQWMAPKANAGAEWIPILHLESYRSLTKAMVALEKRGQPGLYRILQMQRCVWAEMEAGKLRLHGSHHSSPENLAQMVEIYEREGGRRPVEKAREQRAQAKAARSKK
jgi:hypothetical protein